MPPYLQLCIRTFEMQAARYVRVRVVRPADLCELFGVDEDDGCRAADGDGGHGGGTAPVAQRTSGRSRIHAAYEYLSLVHRADYLRCELMHRCARTRR